MYRSASPLWQTFLQVPIECQPNTVYQMFDHRGGGRLQSTQHTPEAIISPIWDRSGRTLNALFFHGSKTCYAINVHWPILYSTILPPLLSCCFFLLKELRCTESLGFFGEYLGSLSSGFLLTTSRDRFRRTGGKVRINKRSFMSTMTKVKWRCFPPTVQCSGMGFPEGDRWEMWGSLVFNDSGLIIVYD